MSRKSESKTEIAAVPGQVQRLAVFGPPLLLEGEDAAAYDELLSRVCAAVKPADIIDEMFIADIVALEWEVLRWRRLKWTLMQETRALLRFNPPDMSSETLEFATSTPQGPDKLATILSGEAKKLLGMDRYERRALARRKFAIRAFDAARARTATVGVNVTRTR